MRLAAMLLLVVCAAAAPASAQLRSGDVTTGIQFQGYDFDDALGVEAANLILLPVAYQLGYGDRFTFDFYTAWARGSALIGGTEFTLDGLVDTRVRTNYMVTPWAMLTLGLSLPTGRTEHDQNEARVAAVLATDLLGFREANFGLGLGATTGIATATRFGATGVGFGLSYRFASEFEPRADTTLKYTPGNEVRVRVGVDRTIAGNKLTAGVTYQNFATDQLDGRDLFQAGNRWRGDVTYSFRTGAAATWTAFLTDVWRAQGDIRLDVLGPDGAVQRTDTLRTGTQNMLIAGVTGAWRIRTSLTIQPLAEVRVLSRQDPGGEGWAGGIGASVPLRFGRLSVAPAARVNFGALQGEQPVNRSFWGGELSLTAGFGR